MLAGARARRPCQRIFILLIHLTDYSRCTCLMMAKGIHECCGERPVPARPLLLQDNREEVTSFKTNKPFLTQRVKRSEAPAGSKTGKKKHLR